MPTDHNHINTADRIQSEERMNKAEAQLHLAIEGAARILREENQQFELGLIAAWENYLSTTKNGELL